MSLFNELKRRNVFKVGAAYLVLAWVVIQIADAAVPALRLPEWVNSLVFLLGMLGFPFAIFFARAFEMTPDGIKKTGVFDYWNKHGFPPQCRPLGDADFECD